MLEKPDIEETQISACLYNAYRLNVVQLTFLPLGADLNTAVYRAITDDGTAYFVKLRRGAFDRSAVAVPKFLSDLGIKQIIPPLATETGALWAALPPFSMILYRFVDGRNGFEVPLSDAQRIEFGMAMKQFHTADMPAALTANIPRESFSPRWRDMIRSFLTRIERETFADPLAAELALFLQANRRETLALIGRAEHLAQAIEAEETPFILCHADIHGWNLLIDGDDQLYVVDWDTLIFAPKERDLMFVGAGLGGNGHSLEEEVAFFYEGYGRVQIDPKGIAYYRCERIIEDIALYCEQIFLSDDDGEDRKQALDYLKSNYRPEGTIEIALGSAGGSG